MRKVTFSQMIVFAGLVSVALALAILVTRASLGSLPLGDFRGVVLVLAGAALFYACSIAVYRAFLAVFPLRPGEIPEGSRQEFVYQVYVLFYVLLFYGLMRTSFTPAPLMRLVYKALGARLGANTYSMGILHDPPFVEIGRDCVVGQSALLVPHVIEGRRLAHYPIRIGNNVTVGANAVVRAGVQIDDGAIVATGAVVPKGTRIRAGEYWGGVPARKLRKATDACPFPG